MRDDEPRYQDELDQFDPNWRERLHQEWEEFEAEQDEDRTCEYCNGTGGDRWNDGITSCPYCDGEGYMYWLP